MNNHTLIELICATTKACIGCESKISAKSGVRRKVDANTAIKVLQLGGKITHRSWVVSLNEYVSLSGTNQLIDEKGKIEKDNLFDFFQDGWSNDATFIAFDEPITIQIILPINRFLSWL